jgi:hypothetical protein
MKDGSRYHRLKNVEKTTKTTLHDEQEAYLNQCERTYGPSHVEDGGGDAPDSIRMKSERTYGPSHVEDGGGDAFQMKSRVMHRSSAVTEGPGSLSSSIVGTGLVSGTGLTGTCAGCSSPPQTSDALFLRGGL